MPNRYRRGIYIAHAIPPRRWFWRLLKIFTKSGFQAATSQEQSLWFNMPVQGISDGSFHLKNLLLSPDAFLPGLDHHRSGFWLFKPQAPENESPPNNRPVTVFSQKGWLVEMAWLSQKRGFEVKIWPKPTFPASKSDQRNSTNQWNHKAGHGFSRPQFVFGLALGTLGAYCYPSLAQPFIFCISAGQGPRPFGRKQQEWWKTYILLPFSIHFEYAWIPNTHIIGSFLVFRTWIVMKSTYYCNFS